MKKLICASILLLTITSCAKSGMINECQTIAERELTEMDGFTLDNTSIDHVDGLKLVIPDEYSSTENVVSIRYKSEDGDYKSCTCYFDSNDKLMGFDAN
jgi:hypothetical protein